MDELVKQLRDAAKMSEALAVLLPNSEGNATAKLYNEAADAIEELQQYAELYKDGGEAVKKAAETYKAAYIAEHDARVAEVPRWIPVTERLPEEMDRSCSGWSAEIRPSDDVLVWLSPEKRQSVAWYSHAYNEWTTVDENTVYCFEEVTHWKPLPEPPEEN